MYKETNHMETKEIKVIDKEQYFCDLCNKEITREYSSRDHFKFEKQIQMEEELKLKKLIFVINVQQKLKIS